MQQQIPLGQTAKIICECQQATLFRLIQNTRSKLTTGDLRLAWLQEAKIYFFNLNSFCQNIFPETPIVTKSTENGITLIFPHTEAGLCGIFIPDNDQTKYFLQNLQNIVQLIPFDNAMSIPQFKDTIEYHCKNIASQPLEAEPSVQEYIQKGGETLKKGFTWLGGVVAEGINKGGQYISSKIDKQEQVAVSVETKEKLAKTKNTVGQTFDVTANFLKQILAPVAEKASELKKDLNQKIDTSNNDTLKKGKIYTVATWDAASEALSGLGTALSQVGDSIGTNTRQLVEKKYGQDVSNTFIGPDSKQLEQEQTPEQK